MEDINRGKLEFGLSQQGGFDYEFILPLDSKYECSICLNAMRIPMQTACGHRFCKGCILSSINSGCSRKCPIDKQPLDESGLFHDSCVEREILQLMVKCPNCILGCKCQTDLRYVDDHLNACSYQPIICPNECSVTVLQRELEDHLTTNCLHRVARCDHCDQPYQLKNEQDHLVVCPEIGISCELCGLAMSRSKIAEHKSNMCPQVEISCPFAEHGCTRKVVRRRLEKHIEENIPFHLQLISSAYKKISTFVLDMHRNFGSLTRQPSLRSQLSTSSEICTSPIPTDRSLVGATGGSSLYNGQMCYESFLDERLECSGNDEVNSSQQALLDESNFKKPEKEELKQQHGNLLDKIIRDLSSKNVDIDQRVLEEMIKVENIVKRVNSLENVVRCLTYDSNGKFCNGNFVWRVPNFKEINLPLMRKGHVLHSPRFYSSQFGYCFCLRTNITRVEDTEFLTLYVHMMKSDNDCFLDWPFQGRIVLSILDCNDSQLKYHISEMLSITSAKEAFEKPKVSRAPKGYGFKEFIPLHQILKPSVGCYVNLDILHIKALVTPNSK